MSDNIKIDFCQKCLCRELVDYLNNKETAEFLLNYNYCGATTFNRFETPIYINGKKFWLFTSIKDSKSSTSF